MSTDAFSQAIPLDKKNNILSDQNDCISKEIDPHSSIFSDQKCKELKNLPLTGISDLQFNISTPHSISRLLRDKLREHPSVKDYGALLGVNDSLHDIPLFQNAYDDNQTNSNYLEIPPGFWPHSKDGIWNASKPQYMYLKFLGPVGWNNNGWSNIWFQLNSDLIEQYVNRTLEFDRAFLSPDAWPVPTIVYNQLFANKNTGRNYNGITETLRINQENRPGVPGSMVGLSVYQYVNGDKGYANQHASVHLDTIRTGSDGIWNLWPSAEDKIGYGPDSPEHAPQQFNGMEMDYAGNGNDRNQLLGGAGRTFIRFVPSPFRDWKKWSANTAYKKGTIIASPEQTEIYIALNTGKSGVITPNFKNNSDVMDGNLTWNFVNNIAMEQGHALFFGGGGNNSQASYNILMGGDANVNFSVLDTSNMILNPTYGASIRVAPGQPLDLCGKTDDKAPYNGNYNECTIQYSKYENGFLFSVHGKPVLKIKNNGILQSQNAISLPIKSRAELRSLKLPKGSIVYDEDDDCPAFFTKNGWAIMPLKKLPSK